MRKLILALAALMLTAPAVAQQTKTQLNTEVSTNFPDNTTGLITPAILRTTVNDFISSWQQAPRVNAQTGTSYAFVVGDYGFLVTFSNGSPVAVTLPQATGSFATFNVMACNRGAGNATITPTTSTINGLSTLVLQQNQCTTIVSDGTNYQILSGSVKPITCSASNWVSSISTAGVPTCTQPAFSDISSTIAAGQIGTTTITGQTVNNSPNASNDYLLYFSSADNAIRKCTVGACGTAGTAGVSSLNGLTGGLSVVGGTGMSVSALGTSVTVTNTGVTSVTCNGGATTVTTTGTCSSRERLSGSRTYFVRSDGNNACNGMTNASGSSGNCAFADAQFALNLVRDSIDLNSQAVTIQYGQSSGTWVLTSSITCSGSFTGGTNVTLSGSASWTTTGTVLDGVTNSVIAIQALNGCTLSVTQLQIKSSLFGLYCQDGGTRLFFGNILWLGSAVFDVFTTRYCYMEQQNQDIITYASNSTGHIEASHTAEFRNSGQTTTFGANAAYGNNGPAAQAFAYSAYGGIIVYTSSPTINLNSKTVTGLRCYADTFSVVEQASLGATFFPGNVNCGNSVNGGYLVQ